MRGAVRKLFESESAWECVCVAEHMRASVCVCVLVVVSPKLTARVCVCVCLQSGFVVSHSLAIKATAERERGSGNFFFFAEVLCK